MMLYRTKEGRFYGFYREIGGDADITRFRTLVKKQWIVKERLEEVWIEGEWAREIYWIEGHYETRSFWVPEYTEMITETVPGGWLIGEIWVEEHWETRRYWIDEDCWYESKTVKMVVLGELRLVTRMVEVCEPAHWGTREFWVAGYWQQTKTWVPEHEETKEVVIPGHHETKEVWVPIREMERAIQRPGRWEFKLIESGAWEDVEVQDPVFSYVGGREEYRIIERKRGPVMVIAGEWAGDEFVLQYLPNNVLISLEAKYLCCCTSIGENEYVCPGEIKLAL